MRVFATSKKNTKDKSFSSDANMAVVVPSSPSKPVEASAKEPTKNMEVEAGQALSRKRQLAVVETSTKRPNTNGKGKNLS